MATSLALVSGTLLADAAGAAIVIGTTLAFTLGVSALSSGPKSPEANRQLLKQAIGPRTRPYAGSSGAYEFAQ